MAYEGNFAAGRKALGMSIVLGAYNYRANATRVIHQLAGK
jgi:hypothetical protein